MADRGQILIIGGEKGGVGKSTITTNLAVELSIRGADVIIIDTDPQKTSVNWIDRRSDLIDGNSTFVNKVTGVSKCGNIKDIIQDFVYRYDVVLIDGAGRDSQALRTGLTVADKFFCPIRASQADLETLPHVCSIITMAKDFNENLKSMAVISCAPTNPQVNEAQEAQELLSSFSDHLGLVNTFIRERKVYRDAMLEGKGVVEMNNEKAKIEFKKFVDEILENNDE
ncbi:division plane positioning ATPase MipZ [Rickettsiaceae bacterium]|nr:division plane positioning ATPase MipZ [Rickettsiaceae bacterium]